MPSPRAASTVLALLVILAGPARTRGQQMPLPGHVQQALSAYLRDPAGTAEAFLDAARREDGALDPVHALFLGDAALRIGRYRMASELFDAVRQEGGTPAFAGAAEIGLAWAALGRGRLVDAYQHLAAAGALSPSLQSFTEVAMAIVGAANGDPAGSAALAALAGRLDADPAFREVAPLLEAYARYWAGDADGAADAFTAFAAAHPNSRFADDAFYAAAQAKRLAGRDAEAQADLEALAGDGRPHGGVSSRLVALDGRALLREGMRRDHELGTRLLPQRLVDLLDGDGGRLARAALAARARAEAAGDGTDGGAGARAGTSSRPAPARDAWLHGRDGTPPAGRVESATARATASGAPGPAEAEPRRARFPWTVGLALASLLLGLGLWLLARARTAQVRSR